MKIQSGNVLFLILIAVVLFAGLSYAVTQSSRGGASVDKEASSLQASQILQSAAQLKFDLDRFMLIKGLDIHDVSFVNSIESGYDNSPLYPNSQRLFHSDGGGASWPLTPKNTVDWLISASTSVIGFGKGTSCTDPTPCAELTLILEDVPIDVCMALNDLGGVVNTNGAPPVDLGDFEDIKFEGTMTSFLSGSHMFNGTNAENDGKDFGCLETLQGYRGGPGKYYFYYVLMTDVHG